MNNETNTPSLPLTVKQAAKLWGCSESNVYLYVEQNRVKHQRVGGGAHRAAAILIMQLERPPQALPGTLTVEQRAARIRHSGSNRRRRKPAGEPTEPPADPSL